MQESTVSHLAPGRSARAVFASGRRDFFRLVRRGAMLELFTAGFYRFWLATDMRSMLWSGTSLEDDPFEYTGTAKELLIGFLFALAILAPIYLVYFLIGIEAERAKAFASVPLVLFFYAFGQFAIFRARRYRATRTVWRGVRLWMTGSGWAFSWRACLWSLFALVTLGLAEPWREAALERYKMRHLHYGDLSGRFEGTGWDLFKRGWWLWAVPALIIGLSITFSAHVIARVLPSLLIIAAPFIYAAYRAILWRWWISGIRIGEVRFESDLRADALVGLYWANHRLDAAYCGCRRGDRRAPLLADAGRLHRAFQRRGYSDVGEPASVSDAGLIDGDLSDMRPLCRRCHPGPARARGMGARGELGHRS